MDSDLTIADWLKPYLPILLAVVRGLIQIASGLGFAWALAVTADQVTMAATIAAMLATLLWSAWQKIAAVRATRRAEVAAAIASAEATAKASLQAGRPVLVPVTVNVTPSGVPNEAVRIRPDEIAGAPSVPLNVEPSPAPKAA